MSVEERLGELGLSLGPVPTPLADYVPALASNGFIYTAGQLPLADGALLFAGKVGAEVSQDQAFQCAQQCALNALSAARAALDDLATISRIVKVTVFVASAPDFYDQALVADGASELLGKAFGEAGRHTRSAVGVSVLPRNAPVEVELIAELS